MDGVVYFDDKKLGVLLIIIAVLLIGFAFYANISNMFAFLTDPLAGDGFGSLCGNERDCREFCSNNRGICNNYCDENPANGLCSKLLVNGK